jgi:hypothetical protein
LTSWRKNGAPPTSRPATPPRFQSSVAPRRPCTRRGRLQHPERSASPKERPTSAERLSQSSLHPRLRLVTAQARASNDCSARRMMAPASSGGSSAACTRSLRSPSVMIAAPAARRFAPQPASPYVAWTNRRPSSSTMPTGTVRGLPDRRPRTVRRIFGAPVGIPAEIRCRVSGLTKTEGLGGESLTRVGLRPRGTSGSHRM